MDTSSIGHSHLRQTVAYPSATDKRTLHEESNRNGVEVPSALFSWNAFGQMNSPFWFGRMRQVGLDDVHHRSDVPNVHVSYRKTRRSTTVRVDGIAGAVDAGALIRVIDQLDHGHWQGLSFRDLEIEVDLAGASRRVREDVMAALRGRYVDGVANASSTRTNVYDFYTGEDVQRWMTVIHVQRRSSAFE